MVLKSVQARSVQVGRRAQLDMRKGYYVYVGSALGPGGVAARLRHHYKVSSRPHWHLDYLRAETEFFQAYALYSRERKECEWASILAAVPGASQPMSRFGASDCQCSSHLFYFSSYLKMVRAMGEIAAVQKMGVELFAERLMVSSPSSGVEA